MKNLIVSTSLLALLLANTSAGNAVPSIDASSSGDSLHVWCSPDLYDLASTWVKEYRGINPEVKTNVAYISADNISSKVKNPGNIGFITKDYLPEPGSKSIWKMAVGRDVIVPVMNPENPYLDEICLQGISSEEFISVFTETENITWGKLLSNDNMAHPVNFCRVSDETIQAYLAAFLQTDQFSTNGKNALGIDEMLTMIHNDKYSLGFCRLVDILDFENQKIDERVKLIPIDVNGNSKVDYFENIYDDFNEFARGVWIGKYPRVLCGNIYIAAAARPTNNDDLAFLEWVLTDGQEYLYTNGYSELIFSEKRQKVQSLYADKFSIAEVHKQPERAGIALIVFAIVLGGGIIFTITRLGKSDVQKIASGSSKTITVFGEDSVSAPGGLFYDKSHTWTFMEKDGYVRIGIDDFLQHVTGRITKIKMKNKGDRIKKGKPFLSLIQDGKQLDIYSPVSGIIKGYNERLVNNSSLINISPYSDGWVYLVVPGNWLQEIRTYVMGEKYRGWLKTEFSRLKDILSSTAKPDMLEYSQVLMQDGGELRDNLLECLGPKDWEEFQTGFIDVSR